jgi:DNA-binding transcriptional LysR family regulator
MNIRKHDLHLLMCFEALAACGSVSKAAQTMSMTQPAMSNALARLRTKFSDELFLRTRAGITPTPKALELIDPVRKALGTIETIMSPSTHFDPQTTRARLTVTTTGYVESVLIPHIVRRLEKVAPGIQLETRAPNREVANERLERGEIDFRIGWVEAPPEKLRFSNLFEDRFVCVVRTNHPQVKRELTLEQFCALPHARTVIRQPMSSAEYVDRAVAAHGRELRIAIASHDYLAVPHIVARTNLIATVPERLVEPLLKRIPIRKLECPITLPRLSVRLFWHDRTHRSALHKWFRSLVTEVAAAL